jgi:hypothetical protein
VQIVRLGTGVTNRNVGGYPTTGQTHLPLIFLTDSALIQRILRETMISARTTTLRYTLRLTNTYVQCDEVYAGVL